jgi:lipoprotein-anchoring transpeptidase ErfK/SrfK
MRHILFIILFYFCLTPHAGFAGAFVEAGGYPPGVIVISTKARKLYYIVSPKAAIEYPVGVGRKGKQWAGTTFVADKRVNPAWSPPDEVKRAEPWLPDVIPPGPRNPMGTRALLLAGGEYAIHGTNKPESVGGFVSYGCIRMYNRDVEELFSLVRVGTPVIVTR